MTIADMTIADIDCSMHQYRFHTHTRMHTHAHVMILYLDGNFMGSQCNSVRIGATCSCVYFSMTSFAALFCALCKCAI